MKTTAKVSLYKLICTRSKTETFGLSLWAYNPGLAIKRAERMLAESGYRVSLQTN